MKKYNQDIFLIHGLWMTPLSWENWVQRYNERGFTVLTPTWPELEGKTVEQVRNYPDILRGVGIAEVVSHYEKLLSQFEKQPMIIGHSFGGIFTQLLLDRGYGCSGVAIHSAPVHGVLRLPVTTLRGAWQAIKNPFDVNGLVKFSFEEFNYAFTNGMPLDEARYAYERYCIPAPKRPLLQVAFSNVTANSPTKLNFNNQSRAPLLMVAGSSDQITPVSINKENYTRYKSTAQIDFLEFKGRNHYTIGQRGWERVADDSLAWSLKHRQDQGFKRATA